MAAGLPGVALWVALTSTTCWAGAADLCRDAVQTAADRTGVPPDVLMAVSLTETGRGTGTAAAPWPWTVNMEGEGHWFDSAATALAFVRERQAQGARSFDLGCFQVNHRWHGDAFASLEAMIDPLTNAVYAAEFLARLYRESGDWSVAAGAYHSRTDSHATRYRALFDAHRARLADQPALTVLAAAAPPTDRQNAFPLLQSGAGAPRMGSLVPLTEGG